MASGLALFAGALVVLLWASDVFVSAAERLGLSLGVSPYIVGATVVAGGTSTPELVSSVLAVRAGAPSFVVGNVVGSNVANVCVVLGLAAVAGRRLRVDRELMRVDLPLLAASAAFLVVVAQGGPIEWFEGLLGLAGMAVYVHFTLSTEARLDEVVDDLVDESAADGADVVPPTSEAVAAATPAGPRTYLAPWSAGSRSSSSRPNCSSARSSASPPASASDGVRRADRRRRRHLPVRGGRERRRGPHREHGGRGRRRPRVERVQRGRRRRHGEPVRPARRAREHPGVRAARDAARHAPLLLHGAGREMTAREGVTLLLVSVAVLVNLARFA